MTETTTDESRKSVLRDVLAHAEALEADVDRILPWHNGNKEEIRHWMMLKIGMTCLKMEMKSELAEESSGK